MRARSLRKFREKASVQTISGASRQNLGRADTPDVRIAAARSVSGLLVLGLILAATLAPASASADPPSVGGCQLFPSYAGSPGAPSAADQTAWNQDVSQTPKDPRSRK